MKKILIIDDDPEFVRSTGQLLKANSYEVISASSGKEGVAKAEDELPDLIIIDVIMETWSEGFNVIDRLRENVKTYGIPRILLTALALQTPRESMSMSPEMMGVESVLWKPLRPAVLLEHVSSALLASESREKVPS